MNVVFLIATWGCEAPPLLKERSTSILSCCSIILICWALKKNKWKLRPFYFNQFCMSLATVPHTVTVKFWLKIQLRRTLILVQIHSKQKFCNVIPDHRSWRRRADQNPASQCQCRASPTTCRKAHSTSPRKLRNLKENQQTINYHVSPRKLNQIKLSQGAYKILM